MNHNSGDLVRNIGNFIDGMLNGGNKIKPLCIHSVMHAIDCTNHKLRLAVYCDDNKAIEYYEQQLRILGNAYSQMIKTARN